MVISFFAIFIVLLVGVLVWVSKGFFSAFLHLLCTIAAGAIAFALWEPMAYWMLNYFGLGAFGSAAWGLSLALPFAGALILLRLAVDSTIRANVQVNSTVDMVGGAACGAAAGVIAAGIFMISVGFLRLPTDALGNVRMTYGNNGEMKRASSIFFPADKIVSGFYGRLSRTAFSSDTPLAYEYPNLAETPSALRITFGEGKARTAFRPGDFDVLSRFTVGSDGTQLQSLLGDSWNAGAQRVSDVDGNPYPANSHIEGFVVRFKAGAKEKGDGKVAVGNGQVRLVIGKPDPADASRYEEVRDVYPIAASCQAEASTPTQARFRYDSRDIYLAGVGGAAEANFGFEFVVPPGFQPLSLYVKNVRHEVNEGATATPKKYASAAERDAAIASGALLGNGIVSQLPAGAGQGQPATAGGGTTPPAAGGQGLDSSDAETLGNGTAWRQAPQGIQFSNLLPFTIQLGENGGLEVNEDQNNLITYGAATFSDEQTKRIITERKLRVNQLATTPDTVTVQVEVTLGQKFSLLGKAAATVDQVLPPVLRDDGGQMYQPIGYVYKDAQKAVVRFKPGEPITGLAQLQQEGVMISRSRSDQKLWLIFRVNKGVSIRNFSLGSKVIVDLNPPLPTAGR